MIAVKRHSVISVTESALTEQRRAGIKDFNEECVAQNDVVAQVWPYLPFAAKDRPLKQLLEGVRAADLLRFAVDDTILSLPQITNDILPPFLVGVKM